MNVKPLTAKQVSNDAAAIDPGVLRFILALVIVAGLTEVISAISESAAWTFVMIVILGLLLNNQLAVESIYGIGKSLKQGVG